MDIDGITIARALHVLGVVLWIGGVAMETTVMLPAMRQAEDPAERMRWFKRIERLFSWQARLTTTLVGLSGIYMLWATDGWDRFADPGQWWLHAMVLVWAIFTVILFVLEPLVLHDWFDRRYAADPDATMALIQRLHWVLLTVSLVIVAAGVIGAHGGIFFG